MEESTILRTSELVLKIKEGSFDSEQYPLDDWERFLNVLCQNREYQKTAIKKSIAYLASDKYQKIEYLVEENYYKNGELRKKYASVDYYLSSLQLPGIRSGCIDLATGTGKSYVMYGIAVIAISMGIVDKVLVLGPPSRTIERGLTEKFNDLTNSGKLRDAIPSSAKRKAVEIINGNSTIVPGCICVENINAVYAKSKQSIRDSLVHNGGRCLVLNDEMHHVYNKVKGNSDNDKAIKKWKEFLQSKDYGFRYVLGFTGTAYIGDDYFNDVIYRYSLKEAIAEKVVKSIVYVDKNTDLNEYEKFQKIYQNHQKNKEDYGEIKPLTILITKDIREAKDLHLRFVDFLVKQTGMNKDFVSEKKVLIVTSAKEHEKNVDTLPYVDDADNQTEWIISVAMLTEGWDVKNVFQIVPMEEKAFCSKLLIAQVLGRGLRVPDKCHNPVVTVYNHSRWSANISRLVNEVMETETTFKNGVIIDGERQKYHFSLYNVNYSCTQREEPKVHKHNKLNYDKCIEFESEIDAKKSETTYLNIGNQQIPITRNYDIKNEKYPVADVINRIVETFRMRKGMKFAFSLLGNEYSNESLPPREIIEQYIRKSMDAAGIQGDRLGKANKEKAMKAFNTIFRGASKTVKIDKLADDIYKIDTKSKAKESISLSSLRQNTSIFLTHDYEEEVLDQPTLDKIKEIQDDNNFRGSLYQRDSHFFKTGVDIVFTSSNPERDFLKMLVDRDYCSNIVAWIKSNSQGFYSIDYSIRIGSHAQIHQFNPDFFLLMEKEGIEYVSVVEIKEDSDVRDENKCKYKEAKKHFQTLNEELTKKDIKQRYLFNFLSPCSYSEYFEYAKDGRLIQGKFKSSLDILLGSQASEDEGNSTDKANEESAKIVAGDGQTVVQHITIENNIYGDIDNFNEYK